jgi:iron/zinc/copper transport system permease protein
VGIILVVAMLITPAATAYLWTDKLSTMLVLSAAVGVVSSIAGLYFSYTLNWASGPAIVLVAAVLFSISFVFSPKQGFIKFPAQARNKPNARGQQLLKVHTTAKAKELQ